MSTEIRDEGTTGEIVKVVHLNDVRRETDERHENWLQRRAHGTLAGGARAVSRSGDPIGSVSRVIARDVAEISFQDPFDGLTSGKTPAKSSGNAIEIFVEVSTDDDVETTTATQIQVTKNGVNFGGVVTVPAGETSIEYDLSAQKIYRNVDSFRATVVSAGDPVTGISVQVRAI